MSEKKYNRTPDTEDKRAYHAVKNRQLVAVRMNAKEKTLLETMMRKDEWESMSGYIKYKLFGIDPDRRVDELIKRKNTDELVILLKNSVLEVAGSFEYFYVRYNKDMSQLWSEEGVDIKAWTRATNKWHAEMTKKLEEALMIIRRIATVLGLEEYFRMPSDNMTIDPDDPSKEKRDFLAAQLRKEQIALGRMDNL